MKIQELLAIDGVVPVLSVQSIEEARAKVAEIALGGLHTVELTLRSACALQAIEQIAKEFPSICIGAGTVVTGEQARQAIACGAQFVVSPGWSQEVWSVCKEADVFYLPGCVTPSEIMTAMAHGLNTVKFFPASVYGGVAAIRALSAPFSSVTFVPTGGVSLSTLSEYLSLPCIAAVGGSWMIAKEKGQTEELVKQTVLQVKTIKNSIK